MKKIAGVIIAILLLALVVTLVMVPIVKQYESLAAEQVEVEIDEELIHTEIKDGAIYINLDTMEQYETMPETISDGDAYLYQDYLYIYGLNHSYGWQVALATSDSNGYWSGELSSSRLNVDLETVFDGKLVSIECASYRPILESINGVPVLLMDGCFMNCINLIEAPAIPSKITTMSNAFSGCTGLTKAPVIGGQVSCIDGTFRDCTSLTGTVEINANVSVCDSCFKNVDMNNITLTGKSIHLDKIGATGLNWDKRSK